MMIMETLKAMYGMHTIILVVLSLLSCTVSIHMEHDEYDVVCFKPTKLQERGF